MEELAEGCVCGRCNASCKHRPFYPCCGACMQDTPYATEPHTWTEFWDDYKQRHPEEFEAVA